MRGISLVGDINSSHPDPGFVLYSEQRFIFINGINIVVQGSRVTNHKKHKYGRTTGSSHISINGRIVTIQGDPDTCGHRRQNTLNTMIFVK